MNVAEHRLRPAASADAVKIADLLSACDLPPDGIHDHLKHFVVVEDDTGDLVGVGGAEIYGRFALLRSLAVRADHRGAGWGERITRRVIEDTRHAGVGELFLLTTTAERYFASRGWEVIPRLDVPEVIAATAEFATLCPSTAIVMRRSL